MLNFQELKDQVYRCWTYLSEFNDAVVQPENFEAEVQQFGSLNDLETWKKAYCRFWAQNIFDSNSDNRTLIRHFFNFKPEQWDYELRYQILEEFLAIPDGAWCISNGLEQIFGSPINTEEERAAHGVFELVSRTAGRELPGISAKFIQRQLHPGTRQS